MMLIPQHKHGHPSQQGADGAMTCLLVVNWRDVEARDLLPGWLEALGYDAPVTESLYNLERCGVESATFTVVHTHDEANLRGGSLVFHLTGALRASPLSFGFAHTVVTHGGVFSLATIPAQLGEYSHVPLLIRYVSW